MFLWNLYNAEHAVKSLNLIRSDGRLWSPCPKHPEEIVVSKYPSTLPLQLNRQERESHSAIAAEEDKRGKTCPISEKAIQQECKSSDLQSTQAWAHKQHHVPE